MIRFLTDENIEGAIFQALRQHIPLIDVVRAQDVGLYSAPDPAILEWASENNRIVLTHDVKTMVDFAYERVRSGLDMPGVAIIPASMSPGAVASELIHMTLYGLEGEWENRVFRLPLA